MQNLFAFFDKGKRLMNSDSEIQHNEFYLKSGYIQSELSNNISLSLITKQ